MWGQGLLTENKFAAKIQSWIQGLLQIPVTLNWKAHSGAITYPDPAKAESEDRVYDGEIPADTPTISHQLALASTSSVSNPAAASDVDLILIDGCANNIGIITVLNPAGNDDTLRSNTDAYCGAGMTNLLSDAVMKYPNANIVVTGYFRYVSSDSDLTALVPVFSLILPLVGVPPEAGPVATLAYKARAAARSDEFFNESNTSLQSAVDTVNGMPVPGRTRFNQIRFARLNPDLSNSYAAPNTWQWLIPTPPLVQDEVYDSRAQQCNAVLASVNGNLAQLPDDPQLCKPASMGHPNVTGAQAYVDAIKSVATDGIAAWRTSHLGPVMAPEDFPYVKVQLGPRDASGGTIIVTAATSSGQLLGGTVQFPGTQPAALGSQVHYTYAANDPTDILATINVPSQAPRYLQIPARKLSVTVSVTPNGNRRTTVVTAADAITGESLSGTVTISQENGQTNWPFTYSPCVPTPPHGRVSASPGGAGEPCSGRVHVPFYPDVSFEDVSVRKLVIPRPIH
jgi:hypothetical protein